MAKRVKEEKGVLRRKGVAAVPGDQGQVLAVSGDWVTIGWASGKVVTKRRSEWEKLAKKIPAPGDDD